MPPSSLTEIATLCHALGDEKRLRIVLLLADGEMCACKLLEHFAITQPTLSHHMKILRACGLVTVRKEGTWSHYALDRATFERAASFFALQANTAQPVVA